MSEWTDVKLLKLPHGRPDLVVKRSVGRALDDIRRAAVKSDDPLAALARERIDQCLGHPVVVPSHPPLTRSAHVNKVRAAYAAALGHGRPEEVDWGLVCGALDHERLDGSERRELLRLRAEVRRLREEQDTLRKAAAIFLRGRT